MTTLNMGGRLVLRCAALDQADLTQTAKPGMILLKREAEALVYHYRGYMPPCSGANRAGEMTRPQPSGQVRHGHRNPVLSHDRNVGDKII